MKSIDKLALQAARLLPEQLKNAAADAISSADITVEEIRLRVGRRPAMLHSRGEYFFGPDSVSARDLESVLDRATNGSPYSARDSLRAGFVTAPGGFRIGVSGTAAVTGGEVVSFRSLSSLAIRIPREIVDCSAPVMGAIAPGGRFRSTLIVSPPGAGKTTLLRDMVRALSDGDGIPRGYRIALADERGEIAALLSGCPQMDVGQRTDVLDACPKASAVMMLLRSMNPQIIALDEVTAPEDIAAIESAANCGVGLLATVHAEDMDDLRARRMYIRMLEAGIFENAVFISNEGGVRKYTVRKLGRR